MAQKKKEIKIRGGDTDILLIAPHAPIISKKPKNDRNTGKITKLVQKKLKCSAIINDVYRKPRKHNKPDLSKKRLDFNLIEQAELHPEFLHAIQKIVDSEGKTTVVWIHGLAESSAKSESKLKLNGFNGDPDRLHALIGYGQGPNPKVPPDKRKGEDSQSRYTATKETAEKFRDSLTKNGLTTIFTREELPNFRGRDPGRMNQWFRNQGYDFTQAESIQLEIREIGFRDTPSNINKTAKVISDALSAFVRKEDQKGQVSALTENTTVETKALLAPETIEAHDLAPIEEAQPDKKLVDEAYDFLKGIFVKHFHNAMLEAGEYIISEFFGSDYERARNPRNAVKIRSFTELRNRLQEDSGHAPSKTWVYDAVKLAIDEHHFKGFSVYGKLGHSQKVLLTRAPENEIKRQLAEETVKQNYTAAELRERINEIKNGNKLRIDHILTRKELATLDIKELEKLENQASNGVVRYQEQLKLNKESLKRIKGMVAEKAKGNGSETKKGRFDDWTKKGNRINICSGCENDCIYCYAKSMARRYGRINGNQWREMTIRQHDVDKNRKLHNGLVGFPSSHDILTSNLDAYLKVLGKLLRAGNEVLIVSKPRLDCIRRICDASQFFKDKILFRFTIGAMADKVLSFWEPNAPKYKERKACLEYAIKNGFRTSVSMEPILDTANITALIKDLDPVVNEDIWLGTMNHLGGIKKGADELLLQEIKKIEAGQTPDKLTAIYNTHKDNPKIKWKTDAWKMVESYLAAE